MSFKLASLLDRISNDPDVAAIDAAAGDKTAHQPEMGMPPGGQTRSPMDGMIGNTMHDQRARAEELALEQAGRQLEANTFDDPREAANARNLANTVGEEVKSPTDSTRQDTSPGNVHLVESPAQKAASVAPAMSFADYVETTSSEGGMKVASEKCSAEELAGHQKTARLYYAKGANMALGHLAEALGV